MMGCVSALCDSAPASAGVGCISIGLEVRQAETLAYHPESLGAGTLGRSSNEGVLALARFKRLLPMLIELARINVCEQPVSYTHLTLPTKA